MTEKTLTLQEQIDGAQRRYEAMSPLDKARHDDAQRRSFGKIGDREPPPNPLLAHIDALEAALAQRDRRIAELEERAERAERALREVDGCFEAAYIEGLADRLSESPQGLGSLPDLIVRRLLPARDAAVSALASAPSDSVHSSPTRSGVSPEIAAMVERNDERYRWLKARPATIHFDQPIAFVPTNSNLKVHVTMIGNTELDAAIDAALQSAPDAQTKGDE